MNESKILDKIFHAKSIAIVGASTSHDKTGHIIMRNMIDGGFKGQIYPINPKGSEILGSSCFPSLIDIPTDKIDLVIIVVPATFVPKVIEDAAKKQVTCAVIISGGFREAGNEDLEKSVVETAKKYGVRFVGPNCQGITYTPNNLCAAWPLMKAKGNMAIISQSGTVGAAFAGWAEEDDLGVSSFVSLGNKSDIDEIDLIRYFSLDNSTSVIGIYLEGVKDGQTFMKVSRNVVSKKPIVVIRPGRTKKGSIAAQSHTKSIAGDYKIFDAACKQAGIIKADTVYELYDFCKIFSLCKVPKGNRCLIITSSGGSGILATDIAERNGVDILSLKEETKTALSNILPPHCIIGNPLDLTGDTNAERYYEVVKKLKNADYIDIVLLIFGDPIPNAADFARRMKEEVSQEIVACYIGGGDIQDKEVLNLHKVGIPVFPTPERAMRAISTLIQYKNFFKKGVLGLEE
jgi:acetyl coenzyme A synthetase (ADP forming)-like protein